MQSAKHKSTPAKDPWSFVHPLTSEDAAAMTALRSAVAGMKGKLGRHDRPRTVQRHHRAGRSPGRRYL
jgi:hypothetical protein